MHAFRIQGGTRLSGETTVDGSKNASLPMMAAALLADEPVTLRGVPELSDITNMTQLLAELGCESRQPENSPDTLTLENTDPGCNHARYDIVRTMRASICVLGPMLARRKHARVSMPGGCAFGARPVDLHLRGLEALGADIRLDGGDIVANAEQLHGTTIFLGGPFGSTVLGTANVMSAATLARGTTVIESAACEPEIADLARLLNAMGARISGAGTPRVTIRGVEQLGGADYEVMPDRIVAATYAMAAAITNGEVILDRFPYDSLLSVVDLFDRIGVRLEHIHTLVKLRAENEDTPSRTNGHAAPEPSDPLRCSTVRVTSQRALKPVVVTTQPYPGFPTDLQAQLMTLLCLADGNSIITEKIYPERFLHVAELTRMGAKLIRQGPTVMAQGTNRLIAAPVMASDLRASACLVLAGLAAEGETIVNRVYHLDRGYSKMEQTLNDLGAKIERFHPEEEEEQREEKTAAARR